MSAVVKSPIPGDEALPCPFCGAKYSLQFAETTYPDGVNPTMVECSNCFSNGPVDKDRDAAIKRWNKRG